jgi:Flp pilus assembly protein TadG
MKPRCVSSLWRALARAEQGAAAVVIAVVAGLMAGVGGLAVDLGRVTTLNTELQKFADAAALRAAVELNGQAGAIARATAAANGNDLGVNRNTFAKEGQDISVSGLRFLSSLDPDVVSAADTSARFVEVAVQTRTVSNFFIVGVGGPSNSPTRASAVGGLTRAVCRVPPLFVCNPTETVANPGAPLDWNAARGKQMLMKAQANNGGTQQGSGNSAAWASGDFGLLQPPTGSGNASISQQLASTTPIGCYNSTVDLSPGQMSASQGLNVRFDMYDQSFNNAKNNPLYRPAQSVVKGLRKQGNNYVEDATYAELGRDVCFGGGSCGANNRLGNGNWDFTAYWNTNHRDASGNPLPVPAALNVSPNPTRYQVYRYEVDNNQIPNPPTGGNPTPRSTGENGHPTTYTGGVLPPSCPAAPNVNDSNCDTPEEVLANYDRRLMVIAVVNCQEHQALLGGAATGIPVSSYAQVFVTEPMKDDNGNSNKEVWAEMVSPVAPGSLLEAAVFKDTTQLYR